MLKKSLIPCLIFLFWIHQPPRGSVVNIIIDFWSYYWRSQHVWSVLRKASHGEKQSACMWALNAATHCYTHTNVHEVSQVQMGAEWIDRKTVGLVDVSAEWASVLPSLPLSSFAPFSYFLLLSVGFLFFSLPPLLFFPFCVLLARKTLTNTTCPHPHV